MAYAVLGAALDPLTRPEGQLAFLATGLLVHDLLLLPVAIGVGALLGHWLPRWAQGIVRAAAIATAALVVVAFPFVVGAGRRPDDPSALPLDYGRGLAVLLVAVWLAAGTTVLVRRGIRGGHPDVYKRVSDTRREPH